MKKLSSVFIVVAATLFSGCASSPPDIPMPKFSTLVKSENNSNVASLEVKPIWEAASIFNNAGISGFSANVKNNTNKVIRVVWEKSSISYGGNSYTLFVTGQKFADSSTPMAATVLPAMGSMSKNIYSSVQPLLVTGTLGGWRMRTIQARSIVIVLCVASGNVDEYFTIEVAS